jgi:hypothetical protein
MLVLLVAGETENINVGVVSWDVLHIKWSHGSNLLGRDTNSPRLVVKPGVTCSGMGRMRCECFRLRHTSWYFVYETTAEPCFDQCRQPGAISSSLCSTTENCNTTTLFLTTMHQLHKMKDCYE